MLVAMSCKMLSLKQTMMGTMLALSQMRRANQLLRKVCAGSADNVKSKISQPRKRVLAMLRSPKSLQRTKMCSRLSKSSAC